MTIDWESVSSTPTKAQRRAMYRFGLPRTLVAQMTEAKADLMLKLLVETVTPQRIVIEMPERFPQIPIS